MNSKLTRRAAVSLALSAPAIAGLDALAARTDGSRSAAVRSLIAEKIAAETPMPDSVIIPGLNQVVRFTGIFVVRTADGRSGIFNIDFDGDADGVTVAHSIPRDGDADWFAAHVPVDPYESLPTWLQREIGLAALNATPSMRNSRPARRDDR